MTTPDDDETIRGIGGFLPDVSELAWATEQVDREASFVKDLLVHGRSFKEALDILRKVEEWRVQRKDEVRSGRPARVRGTRTKRPTKRPRATR
jgi:hypothetical protein